MNELQGLLPLSRSILHLLAALQAGARHGYAVKQHVEAESGGVVRMGPGTLYTSIQRAEDLGLIEESAERAPHEEDQAQRRYYDLTPLGRRALRAEVQRLSAFVDQARATLSRADGG